MTKIVQAKSGQKVDNFKPIYLGNYRYWGKIVCDFWALYQLSLFWLRLFTPTWYFFFLFSCFFFFFVIILWQPLNALHLKFEQLKISGRTGARMKLGVPGLGTPLKPALQSFKLLNRWSYVDKSNDVEKSSTCSSKFLNNLLSKLLCWIMDAIQYTVQYLICWPLGRMLNSVLRIRIVVKCVLIFGCG